MNSKQSYILPLISNKGFTLLIGTLLVVPILAFFDLFNIVQALILSTIVCSIDFLVLASDFLRTRKALKNLSVSCEIDRKLYSGIQNEILIKLTADSAKLSKIIIAVEFPDGVGSVSNSWNSLTSKDQHQLQHSFKFTPLKRGTMIWRGICLRGVSSTGLTVAQVYCFFPEEITTITYPNNLKSISADLSPFISEFGGDRLLTHLGTEGREFDSLRKYVSGDDLRRLDWKQTAKRGFAVVRKFRPETHQQISIAIDCSRRMRTRVNDRLQIDYALDSAAYLSRIAIENNDEVGLFAFNHKTISHLPSSKGHKQLELVMEKLKDIEVGDLEANYDLLKHWTNRIHKRSLIILLTSVSTAASLKNIFHSLAPTSRKHLPLLVVISDRELNQLTTKDIRSLDEAYIQAAAWEQLDKIENRLQFIQRSQINNVFCDIENLTSVLCKKYFELKQMGKI